MARAVAVIEEMLGLRLVDGDDGVFERFLLRHGLEADYARRGFFGAADDGCKRVGTAFVDASDDVCAIVHGDLGLGVDDRIDVVVVGFSVLALDGENRYAVVLDERGGGIVLRRERVRCAQIHFGSSCDERAHEVGGFCRDVQAGADPHAFERTFALETFADACQHGHVAVCPEYSFESRVGQFDVFDVVFHDCPPKTTTG